MRSGSGALSTRGTNLHRVSDGDIRGRVFDSDLLHYQVDNSPAAVSFTVLSQTPRRPSYIYYQNSTIAWAMLIHFGYRIASKNEKAN